jgi:hypothetical protein
VGRRRRGDPPGALKARPPRDAHPFVSKARQLRSRLRKMAGSQRSTCRSQERDSLYAGRRPVGCQRGVAGSRIEPTGARSKGDGVTSTFEWPRDASIGDSLALEQWLATHGWEIDPTVSMAGARGPAVQVRRIGKSWRDGEAGLLILPGEVVEYDGDRMRSPVRRSCPRPEHAGRSAPYGTMGRGRIPNRSGRWEPRRPPCPVSPPSAPRTATRTMTAGSSTATSSTCSTRTLPSWPPWTSRSGRRPSRRRLATISPRRASFSEARTPRRAPTAAPARPPEVHDGAPRRQPAAC